MDCYIGIDLGSTTTKAVYMDANEKIMGRGITNSRSNYGLACQIAREEAEINSRFSLLREDLEQGDKIGAQADALLALLSSNFKLGQHLDQLSALKARCLEIQADFGGQNNGNNYKKALGEIFAGMDEAAGVIYRPGEISRSDFFRDIATSQFMALAENVARRSNASLDGLTGIFDTAISFVEGQSFARAFGEYLDFACGRSVEDTEFERFKDEITGVAEKAAAVSFNVINTIGTGYGRQTLPFPKHQIRSEILCHGLGAHYMFPQTRTVLDIGGQDTKGIQVDAAGIVTNFQMNDRCAAGCGRYLGYIANEMNIGVHELGPLALRAKRTTKINSTCTVFAGAELRERLSLGESREDVLAGMHRAIMLRAMSLLARSGGVRDEFTFTGGVARNQAATNILKQIIRDNYGDVKMNVSPDSIYTGALGAALFAKRDRRGDLVSIDIGKLRKKGAASQGRAGGPPSRG